MYKRVEFAICNYLLKEVRSAGNSGGYSCTRKLLSVVRVEYTL